MDSDITSVFKRESKSHTSLFASEVEVSLTVLTACTGDYVASQRQSIFIIHILRVEIRQEWAQLKMSFSLSQRHQEKMGRLENKRHY